MVPVFGPGRQRLARWRRMRVWAAAHAVDDFYQGLVPAVVPYFVLERHYSYFGASDLAMAATLGSALPQLAIGVLADRRRLRWMSPLGLSLAGTGAGLAGVVPSYGLVWLMLLASGLGVAMFHPPAGRDARQAAGNSATAMSYFAAGGSAGFFLAPALATPALTAWGVRATAIFLPPAALMGFLLLRHQRRTMPRAPSAAAAAVAPAADRWGMFALLTAVEVVRSSVSFGINTFVALYWIRHLGASSGLGGTALTLELAGGALGTIVGGRIGDRLGLVRTVQLGNVLLIPGMIAVLACDHKVAALPLIALTGLVTNIPFAVLVKLGQDYLPTRPGTAAGVTLGLAVSAGGLFMPLLGLVADHHGPYGVFIVLAAIPLIAIALALALRNPGGQQDSPHPAPTEDQVSVR